MLFAQTWRNFQKAIHYVQKNRPKSSCLLTVLESAWAVRNAVHPLGTIVPAPWDRARATGILHLMFSIPTDYRGATLRNLAFSFSVLVFLVGETAMCPTALANKVKPCGLAHKKHENGKREC